MTRNATKLFFITLLLSLFSISFWSCTYESDMCLLEVVVRDSSDSTLIVPNATVHVGNANGTMKRDPVLSDKEGIARFSFSDEAILDIDVTTGIKGTPNFRTGKGTVRLLQGKNIRKEIWMQKTMVED